MSKYYFKYSRWNEIGYIMYFLKNGKVNVGERGRFSVKLNNDLFLFGKSWPKKKYLECSNSIDLINQENKSKIVLSTPGEKIGPSFSDNDIKRFLDNGNIYLSGAKYSFDHKNAINDYRLTLFYFYYYFGHEFLNFYPSDIKNNLVGCYHRPFHINGKLSQTRHMIYDNMKEILKEDLKIYKSHSSNISDVINSYEIFGVWEHNHISSYTDYQTSVVNMLWETIGNDVGHNWADGVDTDSRFHRQHISEKTLKCLLYGKAKIFFMLYTTQDQYKWLIDNGFWLLNFKFLPENLNEITQDDAQNSIYSTCKYLIDLKEKYKTNHNVQKYLLDNYGEKIEKNYEKLIRMITQDDDMVLTSKFINALKG